MPICYALRFAFLPIICGLRLYTNVQEKLNHTVNFDFSDLSPCIKKAAEDVQHAVLNNPGQKITLQGTCHSYSDVSRTTVTPHASKPMNFLHCAQFGLDADTQITTVEPGVRYIDVIPGLKQAGLFVTHGNYAGQTIIGLLQTGTHGAGYASPHNYITELKVVNGMGILKSVTPRDPDFSAWQNGMGVLGAVLQAKIRAIPEFHIDWRNMVLPPNVSSTLEFMQSRISEEPYSWALCDKASCVYASRKKTQKPLTQPIWIPNVPDHMNPEMASVVSSVDGDLYTADFPPSVLTHRRSCEADIKTLNKTLPKHAHYSILGHDVVAIGFEFEIGEKDLPTFAKLMAADRPKVGETMKSKIVFHPRWVPQDFLAPILSPYRYSNMYTAEEVFPIQWPGEENSEMAEEFLALQEWQVTTLRFLGANIRIHLGKGALANHYTEKHPGDNFPATPLADMQQFYYWKAFNDPTNLFTNKKWELFRKYYFLPMYD